MFLAKHNVFLFRVLPGLVAFNTKLMLSTNIGVGLDTLIYIDLRFYRIITEPSTAFFRAVNLAPNVEVCTMFDTVFNPYKYRFSTNTAPHIGPNSAPQQDKIFSAHGDIHNEF